MCWKDWARICKSFRRPGIDSNESITAAIVALTRICKPFKEPRNQFPVWRNRFLGSLNFYKYGLWQAGTITLFDVPVRLATQAGWNRFLGSLNVGGEIDAGLVDFFQITWKAWATSTVNLIKTNFFLFQIILLGMTPLLSRVEENGEVIK